MPNYNNSMPFNYDLETETSRADFNELLSKISQQMESHVSSAAVKKGKHVTHLRLILMNLMRAYRQQRERYVAYLRGRNHYYPQKAGAQGLKIHYKTFIEVIDALGSLGYIEGRKGYNFPNGKAQTARMRATKKLKELIVPIKHVFPIEDVIIFRNDKKEIVSFKETEETKRMRENVCLINTVNSKHFIGLFVPDKVIATMSEGMARKSRYYDPEQITLRRRFMNTFEEHGRFHGAFWIGLPKEYRPFTRIDDEPTVGRDFNATIINLAYCTGGLGLPEGDPYLLPGIDPCHRSYLKSAILMMLNNPSRIKAAQALQGMVHKGKVEKIHGMSHNEAMDLLAEKHSPIGDLFHAGQGLRLLKTESDLAEDIMLRLVRQDIPVLAIHDGFRVRRRDVQKLENAMNEASESRFGVRLPFSADGVEEIVVHMPTLGVSADLTGYESYYERQRQWASGLIHERNAA